MSDADVENFVAFCASAFGTRVMDREAAFVDAHLGDAARVLDVGCGIGAFEERLDRDVVGFDAAAAMLAEARRRTDTEFVQGDASRLPFRDDAFDGVFTVTTLEFLENYRVAVEEARRVLRPSGRFVTLVLNPASRYYRRHREKPDSYFHRVRHDPATVAAVVADRFDADTEYVLGIDGDDVFPSQDPEDAALIAVTGRV